MADTISKMVQTSLKSEKVVKLVIIDDDFFFRELLTINLNRQAKSLLADIGYSQLQISAYSSGIEFFDKVIERPDVIVLDYLLDAYPKSKNNGDEVRKRILAKYPNIPIIMLTAERDSRIFKKLTQEGLENFLIKDDTLMDELMFCIKEELSV